MTRFSLVETDTFFVDAAGASTIGRTRKTNQDQFLVASLEQDGPVSYTHLTLPTIYSV